jgi:hypothetical protein
MAESKPFVTIDPWIDLPERLKVRIYKPKAGFVTGLLQQQIQFGVSNQYSAPFGDLLKNLQKYWEGGKQIYRTLNGEGSPNVVDKDIALSFQELSSLVWLGSNPTEGSLKLTYLARMYDAYHEVVVPCLKLIEFFSAPIGVKANDIAGTKASISVLRAPEPMQIEMGLMMLYREVLPQSCDVVWYNETDQQGHPIRADVTLKFTSKKVYTRDDENVKFDRNQWTIGTTETQT